MVATEELLLPSQEALLQRLQHLACYGQQLVLLQGQAGAGKTRLLTALANVLDEHNLALVSCPQHADAAEIRRKLLIQLLPDPLFDDEQPLADTLLRYLGEMRKPIHILIDDADNMPLALWAECLLLTQLQARGEPITLTCSVSPEFAEQLQLQLPKAQKQQVLPVKLEPLSLVEREGLYQTLLTRSAVHTFTPRAIVVKQLERQQGTPAEVLALLELALNGEPPRPRVFPWKTILISSLAVLISLALLSWYLLRSTEPLPELPKSALVLEHSTSPLSQFAERWLDIDRDQEALSTTPVYVRLEQVQSQVTEPQVVLEQKNAQHVETQVVTARAPESESELLSDAKAILDVQTAPVTTPVTQKSQVKEAAKASQDTKPQEVQNKSELEQEPRAGVLPTQGYTLQLVSLKRESSLTAFMAKLKKVANVRVAKHKDWWVVLVGEYASKQEAIEAGKVLQQTLGLSQPLVKSWQSLQHYRLQAGLSNSEISS
ncbi:AAA family ATPase [Shewanella algae]|uniref:AAA family ATPase n=1 Tax=Shewanella algae TaxID=38313 RepID=UPI000D641734|nr:AAA family ATPase [Shewanella algae]MBO2599092.1 AAA family ATPase [Shewanella algae]MBO2622778.1 AAA family ATPase [Shewanella algae]MDV2963751.1 AAA family ATPase [Shewanella algae]PWF92606.1 AAA family ATPase [Shewanella algae]QHD52900.1 AAA family ATPase [Shewanella algae]